MVYFTPHSTFKVYCLSLSLSLGRMKVNNSEDLAWIRGQSKISQVL
jgi:hypothetical protein